MDVDDIEQQQVPGTETSSIISEPPTNDEEPQQSQEPTETESSTQGEPEPPIKGQWTRALLFSVLAAAFGSSFQFGYQVGCINLPAGLIKDWFNESCVQKYGTGLSEREIKQRWGWAVGILAVGGILGGYSVGILADKLGRKKAMLYNNILAVVAAALMSGAKFVVASWLPFPSYYLFILGRLVIGVNSGLNSGLAPMYLTEIPPSNLRGAIGSFAQLFTTIAILFSQVLGLPFLFGSAQRWPLIFAFPIVPVVVQLCTLPCCPESPKYSLIVRGQKDQAETDLKRLRNQNDVSAELDLLNEEADVARAQPTVRMRDMFGLQLRWPLTLSVFMMISQQFSGINAALFYSTAIFTGAGLKGQLPNYATIAMSGILLLTTVVSVYLVEHPRFGRRTLHIAGLVGMYFSTAMISVSMVISKHVTWVSFLSIVFVLLFMISFAIGPGSIPAIYVNEVFPSNARGNANSLVVLSNWTCVAIIGTFFENLENLLHEYSFLLFTAMLAAFILFALKYLPETKDKTLEEVQQEMEDRRRGFPLHRVTSTTSRSHLLTED